MLVDIEYYIHDYTMELKASIKTSEEEIDNLHKQIFPERLLYLSPRPDTLHKRLLFLAKFLLSELKSDWRQIHTIKSKPKLKEPMVQFELSTSLDPTIEKTRFTINGVRYEPNQ